MTAIVLVNYHTESLTAHFVNKELSKLSGKWSVVVVNNDATPESDTALHQMLDAPVLYEGKWDEMSSTCGIFVLSSPENLGFAGGNNLGAKFAKEIIHPKYILFSNNDIQITLSYTIEHLANVMEHNQSIGIIGPRVVGLNGKAQSPEPYHPFWKRYVWMYLSTPFLSPTKKAEIFDLNYAEKAPEGYHYKVMGSFFMMRTDDFFSIDGMDPNTFLYSEEAILSERLKKIGKKVYYYPHVYVIHAHGLTTKKTIGKKAINQYMMESEAYYYHVYRHIPVWQISLGMAIYRLIYRLKK